MELNLSPTSHPVAADMLWETVATYQVNSAAIRAWIAITYKGVTPAGKRRSPHDVARDLQAGIPGLSSAVATTGGGAAHPVPAAELCEIIRIC